LFEQHLGSNRQNTADTLNMSTSAWQTARINTKTDDPYTTTLRSDDIPLATITVHITPTLELRFPEAPPLQTSSTMTSGLLYISLRGEDDGMAILYSTRTDFPYSRSLAMAKSKSLNLPSSTRTGASIASKSPRPNRTSRRKHTSSGTIAGIGVGGVLILVFIIGGWSFWRRRRRAKPAKSKNVPASEGHTGRDDEKILSDNPTCSARQETSGDSQTQEPHPSQSYGNVAHELRSDRLPGQSPHTAMGGTNDDGKTRVQAAAAAKDDTAHVSPHIEAQRKREM